MKCYGLRGSYTGSQCMCKYCVHPMGLPSRYAKLPSRTRRLERRLLKKSHRQKIRRELAGFNSNT